MRPLTERRKAANFLLCVLRDFLIAATAPRISLRSIPAKFILYGVVNWSMRIGVARRGQLETGCGRSSLAGECRRAPRPDVGRPLVRLSAVPRNLTFGGDGAHRRVSGSATRSGQRLLPLAANGRCRPKGAGGSFLSERPVYLKT